MAGKRSPSIQEHVISTKLSRTDVDQRICPDDLLAYKSFLKSLPDSEVSKSVRPWSSTTAYLQYAGSALTQQLRTDGAPERCHTLESERMKNQPQLLETLETHFQVQQRRLLGYPVSSSFACPPVAMPRPLYRSPNGYVDSGNGKHSFPPLSPHTESQQFPFSCVDWSPSSQFAYPCSPVYASSVHRKSYPSQMCAAEPGKSTLPLSHGLPEASPVNQHREYENEALVSPHPQQETYTAHSHLIMPHNVQTLLYAPGEANLSRRRSSAFTPPSHLCHSFKSNAFQNHYSCKEDSYSHRPTSFCFNTNIDMQMNPDAAHMTREMILDSSCLQVGSGQIENQLVENERKISTDQSVRNLPLSSMDKIQMGKDIWKCTSQEDRKLHTESFQEDYLRSQRNNPQRSPMSSLSPSQNSYRSPSVPSNDQLHHPTKPIVSWPAKESTVASHASGMHKIFYPTVSNNKIDSYSPSKCEQTSSLITELIPVSLTPGISPRAYDQNNIQDNIPKSKHSGPTPMSPKNELQSGPVAEKDIGRPSSPPMPVINDVFSLAPYRAYLEGAAPHPFTKELELISSSNISTSNQPNPEQAQNLQERPKDSPRQSNTLHKTKNESSYNLNSTVTVHCEEGASSSHKGGDELVLDLSLKKLPTSNGYSQEISEANTKCSTSHPTTSVPCVSTMSLPAQITASILSKTRSCLPSQTVVNSTCHTSVSLTPQDSVISTSQAALSSTSQASVHSPSKVSVSSPTQTAVSMPSQTTVTYPCPTTVSLPSESFVKMPSQNSSSWPSQTTASWPSHTTTSWLSQPNNSCSSQSTKCSTSQISTSRSSSSSTPCPPHAYNSQSSTHSLPQPAFVMQAPTMSCPQSANLRHLGDHSVCTSQTSHVFPSKISALCSSQYTAWHSESTRRLRHTQDSLDLMAQSTGVDNESNGFHSSKSFMFKKYKIMKLSSTGGEIHGETSSAEAHFFSRSCCLPSETVQSLPPSAPEASPTLGEANVSLASGGELSQNGSGRHFTELHRSVRMAIFNNVSGSSPDILQEWLAKAKEEERPKSPVKTKSNSRLTENTLDFNGRDVWLTFDGVRLLLHKLLSQLETFMFTRRCPFPHVIRAGAIFIPIYLVKELLFPELLGTSVDRVLQGHKVALRPTTLSEEKLLRETKLKDCPSRMLKLLALKQLPDVYPDLLHMYWSHCVQKQTDAENPLKNELRQDSTT
ncbi:uncharacterized protein C15orf39 homolog isoform X2 [Bombina bombina]|uniref:uncharacterized protein C15orf39 homolog isoform X2 n=1 Tax=Bombina bombina TaxID=8345 RepID=UPI00235AE08D|nr:uncharacterized protein C15orf39 homolog isoform X2 [Bombina bombina]